MKTIFFLGFLYILAWNVSIGQDIYFEKLTIYASGAYDSNQYKIPDVIAYGISAKPNLRIIPYEFIQTIEDGKVVLKNKNRRIDKNSYILNGIVSARNQLTLDFDVRTPDDVENVNYLPLAYGSKADPYKAFSQLIDNIDKRITQSKKIKIEETGNSLRYGIIAETTKAGKTKTDKEQVAELMFEFNELDSLNINAKFIPWDSTRTYSFKEKNPITVLDSLTADFLLRAKFEKIENTFLVKPTLVIQGQKTEIKLHDVVLDFYSEMGYLIPLQKDINDLLKFLIAKDKSLIQENIQFLMNNAERKTDQLLDEALNYNDTGDYFRALFLANKAVEQNPQYYRGHLVLAVVRMFQKRSEEAIANFDKAIQYDGDKKRRANYYTLKAVIFESVKKYDKALEAYKNAIALDPDFNDAVGEINFLIGRSFVRQTEYDPAIKFLEKSLTKKPVESITYWPMENQYWLGLAYYYNKGYEKAIEHFTYVYDHAKDEYPDIKVEIGNAYYEIARNYYTAAKYDEALRYAKESVLYYEDKTVNDLLLLIYNKQKRFKEGRELINVKIKQNYFTSETLRTQGEDIGVQFYLNNLDYETGMEAVRYYQDYLKQNPDDKEVLYKLGNIFTSLNKNDSAVLYLEKSLALKNNNYSVYLDLAESYIKNNQSTKVESLFKSAPALDLKTAIGKHDYLLTLYLITAANRISKKEYESVFSTLKKNLNIKNPIRDWEYKPLKDWISKSDLGSNDKDFLLNTLTKTMEDYSIR